MDGGRHSISPDALDAWRGADRHDVRRDAGSAKPHAIRPDRDRTRAMNSQ